MTPRVFVLVLILAVAHLFMRVALGLGNESPDMFVLVVLIGSRYLGLTGGAALGFTLGLVEDAFSMRSFGSTVFALTVLGAAGSQSRHLFVGNSVSFLVAYFAVGKWLRDLLGWIVSDSAGRMGFGDYLLFDSPLAAIYASAVGTIVSWVFLRRSVRA